MSVDKAIIEYEADISKFRANLKIVEDDLKKSATTAETSSKKTQAAINNTGDSVKNLSKNTGELNSKTGDAKKAFESLPGPLGQASQSVNNLSDRFKALLLNPIVLTIAAITGTIYALFKAFVSTDDGANKFDAILKQISTTIDVVQQRLAVFAGGLIDIFSGNFTEGAEKMSGSFKGITEQINNATKAASEYIFALDALEDAERNYISERAKNSLKISQLEFDAADKNKTLSQRRLSLEEAIKIGKSESEQSKKFAEERYNIELNNAAATLGVNRDYLKKYIELNAIQAEEQQKINDDARKIENTRKGEIAKNLEELFAIQTKAEQDYFDENRRNIAKLSAFNEQAAKEEEDRAVAALKAKNLRLKGEGISPLKAKGVKDDILAQSELEADAAEKEYKVQENLIINLSKLEGQKTSTEEEASRLRIEIAKDEAAEKKRIFDENTHGIIASAQQTSQLLSAISQIQYNSDLANLQDQLNKKEISQDQFNKKQKELAKKKAEQDKAIAIFNAIISGASAVLQALASAPPPYNVVLAALSGGLAAAQIGIISSQEIPEFAKGTKYLQRGKNKAGVDTIPIMANEGEAIIPTDINRRHKDIVGAMFDGNLNDIIQRNYVAPALREMQRKHESNINQSFAENIVNSLKFQNNFDDYNIVKGLKQVANASRENTHYLGKVLRMSISQRNPS